MQQLRWILVLLVLTTCGCADVVAMWTRDYEDRQARIGAGCRSLGHVTSSPQFERCVDERSQPAYRRAEEAQAERVEAMRTGNERYSKDAAREARRPVWVDCRTLPDGRHGCEGR